jgi:hypothetical protein
VKGFPTEKEARDAQRELLMTWNYINERSTRNNLWYLYVARDGEPAYKVQAHAVEKRFGPCIYFNRKTAEKAIEEWGKKEGVTPDLSKIVPIERRPLWEFWLLTQKIIEDSPTLRKMAKFKKEEFPKGD